MINIMIISPKTSRLTTLADAVIRAVDDSTTITTVNNEEEALNFLSKCIVVFDLFIIDIKLERHSGYVIEKQIRCFNRYKDTPTIFITESSYSLVGFSKLTTYNAYKHRNFISLPLDEIDIQGKVGMYIESIISEQLRNDARNKLLDLKTIDGIKRISPCDILFLEIQNKTCTIYTAKGKFIIRRTSLTQVIKKIGSDDIVRCHRFFAINKEKISYIERVNSKHWYGRFEQVEFACPISYKYFNLT